VSSYIVTFTALLILDLVTVNRADWRYNYKYLVAT